jgi:hypothetical protein
MSASGAGLSIIKDSIGCPDLRVMSEPEVERARLVTPRVSEGTYPS